MQKDEFTRFRAARFYSSVSVLFAATLLFAWYVINPYNFTGHKPRTLALSSSLSHSKAKETIIDRVIVTGKPLRLVIPSLAIDLPVDEGNYNEAEQTWTLSAKHAQFALPSMNANNIRGNTLIYGHYNKDVFYNLKKVQPMSFAEVHTDNGHLFIYAFKQSEQLKPDDVTVFDYQSYPMLTLQTCSGSFYEYRQMFHFSLVSVDGQNV